MKKTRLSLITGLSGAALFGCASEPDRTPPIMCFATGAFESAVIDLVQQAR